MKREERLAEIASEYYDAVCDEKSLKKRREELRKEFFRLHDAGFGANHILPVRTVEVPESFFKSTGLTQDEFIKRRFPGWAVEHCELSTVDKRRTYVLKRDTNYVGGVVEVDYYGQTLRVSKEVIEYSPEVDFDSLSAERPDLAALLAKEVVTQELDEEAFEKLMAEHPEELSTVERHLVVREPALRATAKVVKDEG